MKHKASKFLSLLITLVMVLGLAPVVSLPVWAATVIADGTFGAGGDNLTWSLDDDGVLTISGTGAMDDYASYSDQPWHDHSSNIEAVSIGNGVTKIGNNAFKNRAKVKTVTFESGSNLKSIGDNAFEACYVTAPASIAIPKSIESIGKEAFFNCYGLNAVTFVDDSQLASIGDKAFGSTGLTSIEIPAGVTSIGKSVFSNCKKLTNITVPTGNQNYCAINGVLYDKNMKTLICCPAKTGLSALEIPASVETIEEFAFCGCQLPNITFAAGSLLTTIEKSAFDHSYAATAMVLPDGLKTIGQSAFYECGGLEKVEIPESIESCAPSAFANCYQLKDAIYRGTQAQWEKATNGVHVVPADIMKFLKCELTFNAKGKGTEPNAVVMETNAIPSENADIGADGPQLTEDHYAFDGWYDNEACAGDKFDFTKPLAKDTEVLAKWVESYTISYELDGGTNNENNPASYTAESGTITLKPPRRPGYTFSGWYDNDTFSGSPVTEISQGDKGDRTFYAKWTKNSSGGGSATTKYTLTYNTNGGNSITATKHNKNATVNLTATPTREGYDFTGWYADKELKNAVTSVKMDDNKTVYAGWKEIPIFVVTIDSTIYQLNGKTMTMDSAPFIDGNNRTMLPVRVIANALGITNDNIKWDSATKTAFFTREDGKVVSCTVNSNVIQIGDESVTIDTVPVIRNGRIYLPMRALFNAFDVPDENIIWDATARTVTVTKKD